MLPASWSLQGLELVSQQDSHVQDSLADHAKFLLPLLEVLRISQDGSGNLSSVSGWVRVLSSDDDLQLRENLLSSILINTDEVDSTNSFSIETHILGKRLGDNHLESLFLEVSDSEGISDEVSGSKSLVGTIEDGDEVLFLHYDSDLFPLLLSWVNSGWVVSARVQ